MKTLTTSKGSKLPLMQIKGKDYLNVAYRIQWLSDDVPEYTIKTEFLKLDETIAVARATVTILGAESEVCRSSTATKSETPQGFADYIEKAETSAIGRALAMLGFGTQFALADLDEGERLADSPLQENKDERNYEGKTKTPVASYNVEAIKKISGANIQEKNTETPSSSIGNNGVDTTKNKESSKALLTKAFKILKAQGKTTAEGFKETYLGGIGLSQLTDTQADEAVQKINKTT